MSSKNYFVVDWNKISYTNVNVDTYNTIVYKLLNNSEIRRIERTDVRRLAYFDGTYQIIHYSKSESEIRYYYGGDMQRYIFSNYDPRTIKKANANSIKPTDCYNRLNDLFRQENGVTITKAFTSSKYKELYNEIKKCVPAPPNYAKSSTNVFHNCYKADVSSCYPSQLLKPLPTLRECKVVAGKCEPTEDYPFAFYLKSHHIKIYNELDSHDFLNKFYEKYYVNNFVDGIDNNEEVTVLCMRSKYVFNQSINKLYDDKQSDKNAKLTMNITIGCFHRRKNPTCSHVAAIVLARCVNDMILRAKRLEKQGNKVLLINTDSIIWQGKNSDVATNQKAIGNFVLEETNIDVVVRSCKIYQYLKADGTVITRYSGNSDHDNIKLGDILNMPEYKPKIYTRQGDIYVEEKTENS